MAVTNGWGQATQNNTNGFGKYQNTIDAGSIYADSYAGETSLVGTSAAFSYSASSFHQDESDPTPTITGTAGGTFSATPSGLSINTSTGTIDLDNSTIQSYTITYTVSGVSSSQSLAVTASPFIANNFSMLFTGTSYVNIGSSINLGTSSTISFWHKTSDNNQALVVFGGASAPYYYVVQWGSAVNKVYFRVGGTVQEFTGITEIQDGNWHHYCITRTGANAELFIDGASRGTLTGLPATTDTLIDTIGATSSGTHTLNNSHLDEVAFWNTALSSDAVTEIYNATANNTGKALDLSTDTGNYTNSSSLFPVLCSI
jgi:hypothetical protein